MSKTFSKNMFNDKLNIIHDKAKSLDEWFELNAEYIKPTLIKELRPDLVDIFSNLSRYKPKERKRLTEIYYNNVFCLQITISNCERINCTAFKKEFLDLQL